MFMPAKNKLGEKKKKKAKNTMETYTEEVVMAWNLIASLLS